MFVLPGNRSILTVRLNMAPFTVGLFIMLPSSFKSFVVILCHCNAAIASVMVLPGLQHHRCLVPRTVATLG